MFNPEFNEARQMLKFVQDYTDPLAVQLNALNPQDGGPGVNPHDAHRMIGTLVASVHNLAMTVGKVVDYLDEQHNANPGAPTPPPSA